MILQSLVELYERLKDDEAYDLPRPGFSPQKISFRVVLRPDGTLFDIQDTRTKDDNGRIQSTRMLVCGEAKSPGAGLNPCFLWDNQTYLLGRQPEDKPEGFAQKRFEAFRDKHLGIEKDIHSEAFSAVCRFFESWNPERIAEFPILNDLTTGFGILQIQGEKKAVHEMPEVLAWWENQNQSTDEADAPQSQCLVTGLETTIARLQPKIKGVVGGQAAGGALVSFNNDAYESYGKTQSYNGPVGVEAVMQYGAALNAILAGPMSNKHRIRIGDTTCVFWTDRPSLTEDVFALFASEGSHAPEKLESQDEGLRLKLEAFLRAVRQGRQAYADLGENPDETRFFLLGLSPNAGRLSVRFFHRSSLGELLENLHRHLEDMHIVPSFDSDPDFPASWQLLAQSYRKGDDAPPLLAGALLRAILEGTRYPEALYGAVLRRIHMERQVPYLKAALLKAVLVRNHQKEIPVMLDTSLPDPAYRLGRLFAVLEKTQSDAGNTGVRERFYSSASATPATVFPRILRTYTHWLAKLSGGQKVVRERLMQEIMEPLNAFPQHLNLTEQGQFAIGYYHQRKDLFTAKESKEPVEIIETEETSTPIQGELL